MAHLKASAFGIRCGDEQDSDPSRDRETFTATHSADWVGSLIVVIATVLDGRNLAQPIVRAKRRAGVRGTGRDGSARVHGLIGTGRHSSLVLCKLGY